MRWRTDKALAIASSIALAAQAGTAASAQPYAWAKARPRARIAAALRASDRAQLRYRGAVGEEVYETGSASGTLPGSMRVHMVFAATFSGHFTIYTRGGSIDGHGSARPHGGGVYESFAGTLVVTSGTGRYRHAHGRAALYGTFNRDDYALSVQTAGTLRY